MARKIVRADLGARSRNTGGAIRNLDVHLECRDRAAAIHLHLHLVGIQRYMPRDHRKDLLPQGRKQIGLSQRLTFVGEQDRKPLARSRRRAATAQELEQVHAALRPNSLPKSRLLPGMSIVACSPLSFLAAAM